MKKAVIVVFVLLMIIVACLSFSLLLSQSGLAYYFNKNIACTYTIKEKENLAQVISSNPRRKEWLNKSKMSSREKKDCLNNPEEYDLIYFDLEIQKSTDYWIMMKPLFKDAKNVWFVRESFIQNEKGTPIKAAPQDSSEWSFGMIVKTDQEVKDIDQSCFKSLAFAKIVEGPLVSLFVPKTELKYAAQS